MSLSEETRAYSARLEGQRPARVIDYGPLQGPYVRDTYDPDAEPPINPRTCLETCPTTPGDLFGPMTCDMSHGHNGEHRTSRGGIQCDTHEWTTPQRASQSLTEVGTGTGTGEGVKGAPAPLKTPPTRIPDHPAPRQNHNNPVTDT